jgi:hypothetical protein
MSQDSAAAGFRLSYLQGMVTVSNYTFLEYRYRDCFSYPFDFSPPVVLLHSPFPGAVKENTWETTLSTKAGMK